MPYKGEEVRLSYVSRKHYVLVCRKLIENLYHELIVKVPANKNGRQYFQWKFTFCVCALQKKKVAQKAQEMVDFFFFF